jgi:hypothetical protein
MLSKINMLYNQFQWVNSIYIADWVYALYTHHFHGEEKGFVALWENNEPFSYATALSYRKLAELLQEFPKLQYVNFNAVFFSGDSIRKHAGQHHAYMRERYKMNREDRDEEVNDWI